MKKFTYTIATIMGFCATEPSLSAQMAIQKNIGKIQGSHIIGILSAQKVLNDSKAYQDIQRQIEDFRQKIQDAINKREAALRKEEAEIIKLKSSQKLSGDQFEKKKSEFEKKVSDLHKDVVALKTAMEDALQEAMEKVKENIKESSEEVAKEKGINHVMLAGAFVTFDPQDDLTEIVLKRHNEKMPTYKVSLPREKFQNFEKKIRN